ncbi:MAG TPA: TlpA disulfide reductase family protein [Granulicella sp.]|jgi:thiol-disulfide isomerase/thioredoxin|nr:TlpA disulfide reductase family protein [Granulicella sp.]
MSATLRALTLLAAGCLSIAAPAASAKRLPALQFRDLAGHPQQLSSLRGSIVVLSFWATWCAPCREELPRLAKLNREYAARGVRFLAVSADEPKDRSRIEPYLNQQNLALDVWLGANSDVLERVGLGNILPGTLILDQKGEVIGRIMGEARESDIRSRLDWLLQGRSGPPPSPLTKRY